MAPRAYEIRFRGEAGPTLLAAFSDFPARADRGLTVLHCAVEDQAGLFGVLNRVESLGLELVEVRSIVDAGGEDGE